MRIAPNAASPAFAGATMVASPQRAHYMHPAIDREPGIAERARRATDRHHFMRRPGREDDQSVMLGLDVDKALRYWRPDRIEPECPAGEASGPAMEIIDRAERTNGGGVTVRGGIGMAPVKGAVAS